MGLSSIFSGKAQFSLVLAQDVHAWRCYAAPSKMHAVSFGLAALLVKAQNDFFKI
jgi:hypothetical protein